MQAALLLAEWPMRERRTRRSSERPVALRYQLEHACEAAGLEALVLADADGLVLSGSGDRSVCAELGAVAPLIHRAVLWRQLPPLLSGSEVQLRRIEIDRQELYLAWCGGALPGRVVDSVASAVRRILQIN